MAARYEGRARVEFLPSGRDVKLLAELTFFDPNEERWVVPADAQVDGASISKLFWSAIGGPFEGKYRDASIIHDWFCDIRTRTWQETHRVFYEAMIVSGVAVRMAKVMYFAVRWAGPRWEERVSVNTRLSITKSSEADRNSPPDASPKFELATPTVTNPSEGFDPTAQKQIFDDVSKKIIDNNYSLDRIDGIANSTINNTDLGEPSVMDAEAQIVARIASYGKQLGRIGNSLAVILRHVKLGDLRPDEQDALDKLKGMLAEINTFKKLRLK